MKVRKVLVYGVDLNVRYIVFTSSYKTRFEVLKDLVKEINDLH